MTRVLHGLVALLGAVCVAAIWSLLALNGVGQWWLAPLAAGALVLYLHSQGWVPGLRRAVLAVVLFLAGAAYATYIEASGSIAAELGLTLVEGLRRIGPEMAWAWTRAHREGVELGAYALGAVLALTLGYALGRQPVVASAPQRRPRRRPRRG